MGQNVTVMNEAEKQLLKQARREERKLLRTAKQLGKDEAGEDFDPEALRAKRCGERERERERERGGVGKGKGGVYAVDCVRERKKGREGQKDSVVKGERERYICSV